MPILVHSGSIFFGFFLLILWNWCHFIPISSPDVLTSAVPLCVLNVVISAHISADWGDFAVGHQGVRFHLLLLLNAEAEDVADRMILRRSGYIVVLHSTPCSPPLPHAVSAWRRRSRGSLLVPGNV